MKLIQNRHTKIAFYALIIASILSSTTIFSLLSMLSHVEGVILLLLLTPLIICINLFVAYKIYQGEVSFIRFSFWLYVIQIVGFEIGGWGFSFLLGFTFHLTWAIGESSITINFFAILMSVLLFKAIKGSNKT